MLSNCARYTVDGHRNVVHASGALQAPAIDGQGLATSDITLLHTDGVDLGVGLDVPAVVSSKVAMLGSLSLVSVADAETHLGVLGAGMLVASLCLQAANSVAGQSGLVVDQALRVAARTRKLDEDDGVHVIPDTGVLIGGHWVQENGQLLVEVHVGRGNVVQVRCVPHRVPNVAQMFLVFGAGRVGGLGLVRDLELELNVFIVVSDEMSVEGLHGDTTKDIGDGWERVCQSTKVWCRLDFVVDYLKFRVKLNIFAMLKLRPQFRNKIIFLLS